MVKCQICGKELKSLRSISYHLWVHDTSVKDYYDQYLCGESEGFCKTCGSKTTFNGITKGYNNFCSTKCSSGNQESINKRKETMIERYGGDSPKKFQSSKRKPSEETKQKIRNTMLRKYGVDNPSKSPEIKQKIKDKFLEKYNVSNPNKTEQVRNKFRQTMQDRYGVDNPFKLESVKEKIKETNRNNLGSDYPFASEYVKEKIKETNLEKYGVEYPAQNDEIKEKQENTSLEKYGFKSPSKSDGVKKKISDSQRNNFLDRLNTLLSELNISLNESYENCNHYHNWYCNNCDTEFTARWDLIQQGYGCLKCDPRHNGTSKPENELFTFLSSFLPEDEIHKNVKNIIFPYEIDIYIPSKSIAIEFDGLYWHSDDGTKKYYHLEKTKMCEEKGIRLIHIFEDEWLYKPEIVKSRLKQILNENKQTKINARECEIREIDPKTKNSFLDNFHLQGKDSSIVKLGAFYKNELVAVMTFSKGNISKGSKSVENVWELNRFAIDYNYNVVGIAGKMLSYFKNNYNWNEIFTYADRRWSNGNLYYKLGFMYEHSTEPNYWYMRGLYRIHRFNLRKTENDPKDIPEWILREQEGYRRIWDCGNFKFRMVKRTN